MEDWEMQDSDATDLEFEEAELGCQLLGEWGSLGWWLQGVLGFVCFSSLVYKRYTDAHRRPWLIWFLDTSKQGVAAMTIHSANLGISVLLGSVTADVDGCSWYWVSVLVDCTIGVLLTWVLFNIQSWYFKRRGRPELADSGEYGNPPNLWLWLHQCYNFQVVVLANKLMVFVVFLLFRDALGLFATSVLGLLAPYPRIKLCVVMIVTPLILNIFAFWALDNIIMKERPANHSPVDDYDCYEFSQWQERTRRSGGYQGLDTSSQKTVSTNGTEISEYDWKDGGRGLGRSPSI